MHDHRRPQIEPSVLPAEEPLLAPQRAFVVQFRDRTGHEQELFTGRVEHIMSGQATRFRSLDGLIKFLIRVLTEEEGRMTR
jgi:hypothetical protein